VFFTGASVFLHTTVNDCTKMSNSSDIRWKQRFANFQKAMVRLSDACDREEYSELERSGLVQTFEFSFELAWNTLKDVLSYEGFETRTPREAIRTSFTAGYLNEMEAAAALDALEKRNLLSHNYDEATAIEAVDLIKHRYAPMLLALLRRLDDKLERE
jgi:nucleotidyltransferase substrate binding protein (TIGR01987 family)